MPSCILSSRCFEASNVSSSQSFKDPSAPPVAMYAPSPPRAIAHALSSCASNSFTANPFLLFQTRSFPSPPTEASCCPDDKNFTANTAPECDSNDFKHGKSPPVVLEQSHKRMILSPPAVATDLSASENAIAHTPLLCPRQTPAQSKSGIFQSFAVRSAEADATSKWFGDTATPFMALSCATVAAIAGIRMTTFSSSFSSSSLLLMSLALACNSKAAFTSHIRKARSCPPETTNGAFFLGAKATEVTALT